MKYTDMNINFKDDTAPVCGETIVRQMAIMLSD